MYGEIHNISPAPTLVRQGVVLVLTKGCVILQANDRARRPGFLYIFAISGDE